MDSQIIVLLLFLLFSIISAIYKRLKHPEPDESKLQRRHPSRDVGNDPFEEAEADLSEWEVLFDPPKPEPKPKPLPEPPSIEEFEEVRGKRSVSEANTGPEFQEVRGKRKVDETDTKPEFQEVQGKRPVSDVSSYVEGRTRFTRASKTKKVMLPVRKRRIKLDFEPDTIRKAIIYNEILGSPRADRMPF